MSIQRFPLKTIQKIRQYIKSSLSLPATTEQKTLGGNLDVDEDVPEPESLDDLSDLFGFGGGDLDDDSSADVREEWVISTVNPAAALIKLPGLRLKPEFRLVSYLYRAKEEGFGVVRAVPELLSATAQLEKALANCSTASQLPQPEGALPHFMEAIDGDRSPASFLIASILKRELEEFGALGKQCNWSHHHLIDDVPPKLHWQWRTDQPKDFAPKVKVLPDGQAAVEFFTCQVTAPVSLYRHLDQYPGNHYKAQGMEKKIAEAHR